MSSLKLFVTGTDTDIGKTVVSSVLVEALRADYWKPVQSGDLDQSDTDTVRALTKDKFRYHPEAYRLQTPMSPHASAHLDGIQIDPSTMLLPDTQNALVVEGAGGLMVPLNQHDLLIDWAASQWLTAVIVSGNKLGSINHTLLTVEALMNRNMEIAGIVFNGDAAPESEEFIIQYTGLPVIAKIPHTTPWTAEKTAEYAEDIAAFFGV